jgi:hypothetical protein
MTPFDGKKPRAGRGLEHLGKRNKKTDVAEHPKVSRHVGLPVNEPSGQAGLPFI